MIPGNSSNSSSEKRGTKITTLKIKTIMIITVNTQINLYSLYALSYFFSQ